MSASQERVTVPCVYTESSSSDDNIEVQKVSRQNVPRAREKRPQTARLSRNLI